MPHVVIYKWPAASTTSIAALQSTSGAGNLILNGSLLNSNVNGGLSIVFTNQQRFITLTSTNNLAAVTFIITGTLQGSIVSASLAGPNDNTVTTTQLFDSVTSISVSGAVTAVSVGTGLGQTNWATYSDLLPYGEASVAVVVTGTITYTLNVTLDDVNTVASPNLFNPISAMTAADTTEFEQLTPLPITFANVSVGSGTGSLVFYFCQQGDRA